MLGWGEVCGEGVGLEVIPSYSPILKSKTYLTCFQNTGHCFLHLTVTLWALGGGGAVGVGGGGGGGSGGVGLLKAEKKSEVFKDVGPCMHLSMVVWCLCFFFFGPLPPFPFLFTKVYSSNC